MHSCFFGVSLCGMCCIITSAHARDVAYAARMIPDRIRRQEGCDNTPYALSPVRRLIHAVIYLSRCYFKKKKTLILHLSVPEHGHAAIWLSGLRGKLHIAGPSHSSGNERPRSSHCTRTVSYYLTYVR